MTEPKSLFLYYVFLSENLFNAKSVLDFIWNRYYIGAS